MSYFSPRARSLRNPARIDPLPSTALFPSISLAPIRLSNYPALKRFPQSISIHRHSVNPKRDRDGFHPAPPAREKTSDGKDEYDKITPLANAQCAIDRTSSRESPVARIISSSG
jgi:hypothetical protein